jgi:beta-glucosidase-like glycosyl hydrolase
VESPGEDPYLNGQYGSAYTEGLQAFEDEGAYRDFHITYVTYVIK